MHHDVYMIKTPTCLSLSISLYGKSWNFTPDDIFAFILLTSLKSLNSNLNPGETQ